MIRLTDIICEINPELIDEAGRYKSVVRNRKKIKKLVHRPGYKIVNGKLKWPQQKAFGYESSTLYSSENGSLNLSSSHIVKTWYFR